MAKHRPGFTKPKKKDEGKTVTSDKPRFPPINKNLRFRGFRTMAEWQELSSVFEIVTIEDTIHACAGEVVKVFPHPYDSRCYVIADSHNPEKCKSKIIFKNHTRFNTFAIKIKMC